MKKRKKKPINLRARMVPRRDGEGLEVVRIGQRRAWRGETYVRLMNASWLRLIVIIGLIYVSANILFAAAYLEVGDGIVHARPGSFEDAFFFSVQTMATIGYGNMYPVGTAANILATLEALTGFALFAVVTGLVFAKFSRPTARVLFSKVAVIGPHDGAPHLILRMANERGNRIVEAKASMVLARTQITKEGVQMRYFHDLPLVRNTLPVLNLSWSLRHIIDSSSPLYKSTPETLRDSEAEVIVSLSGVDETLSQTIYARYSYVAEEIICNAAFVDILKRTPDGRLEVYYHLFHDVKQLEKA